MLKITALLCVMSVALVCANPTVQKENTSPVAYSNFVHEEPKPLASFTWYTGSYCNDNQYANTCDGLCHDKRANYQTYEATGYDSSYQVEITYYSEADCKSSFGTGHASSDICYSSDYIATAKTFKCVLNSV